MTIAIISFTQTGYDLGIHVAEHLLDTTVRNGDTPGSHDDTKVGLYPSGDTTADNITNHTVQHAPGDGMPPDQIIHTSTTTDISGDTTFHQTRIPEITVERCPDGGLTDWTAAHFPSCEALVFIGSVGIAVRAIAPHVSSKTSDPAVVVIDDQGRFVLPILSGHIGGANALANRLARAIGATPVLTTATDTCGVFAVDSWAIHQGLRIANPGMIKLVSAKLLAGRDITISSEFPIHGEPPPGVRQGQWNNGGYGGEDVLITCRTASANGSLHLIPPALTAGIGCRKGTSSEVIQTAFIQALEEAGYDPLSVATVCSIDLKAAEPGLQEFCAQHTLPLRTFSAEQLALAEGDFTSSAFVESIAGVDNVCERAAVAGSGGHLVAHKKAYNGVTIALALREPELTWWTCNELAPNPTPHPVIPPKAGSPEPDGNDPSSRLANDQSDSQSQADDQSDTSGILTLVGMGPGSHDGMTFEADEALRTADFIVGYKRYVQLLRPIFPDKEYISTGMTHEVDRCREALRLADAGHTVALVSSGDAGVYAMAGLVYELSADYPDVDITTVPGVTAATSGAALLGAPIGHDFAVISLSDRLTDWDLIEQRLDAAAQSDFCIVLYNPSSRTRADHLFRACEILLRWKPADTICGLASRIGREGEYAWATTLGELGNTNADMFTTVFIGNNTTVLINGKMVTPRGYGAKL